MNDIVNKFLLAGDKFMPEFKTASIHLYCLWFNLLKTKKEFKNLCRPEIPIIFTRMILI